MECIVSFRFKPGNQSSFGTYQSLEILDVDKGKALVRGPYPGELGGNAIICGEVTCNTITCNTITRNIINWLHHTLTARSLSSQRYKFAVL